jgi:16S rRNA (cytosine967-C5)-methyltransferase
LSASGSAGVSPARSAAWRALLRLRAGTGRVDDSLASLPELERLGTRDRALANELVTGSIKRRASLDAVLGAFTKASVDATDGEVLEALRLATFQLLFLDRVPAYAVVDDAVALVARRRPRAKGFVNAVLRRVAEDGPASFATLSDGDGARAWAVRYSCPLWLVKLLRRELGDERTERFLAAANAAPERCLRVNVVKVDVPAARGSLAAVGFATSGVSGLPAALIYDGPPLERSGPFRDGLVTPQSRGSQVAGLVAAAGLTAVAGAGRGSAILDLCAAPGTKTAQLAALVPLARITAVDADAKRLMVMKDNLARLGVTDVDLVRADVLDLPASYDDAFDMVLLDAPCSGLGTVASRADLRWQRRLADIARLAQLQRRLLRRAARCVKPGGTLTYAVCTLTRAETLEVVESLLAAGGWAADDLGAVWPGMAHPDAGGFLLALPPVHGASGFFVARLRRIAFAE